MLRLAAEAASFSTDPARAVRLWEEAIEAAGPDATPAVRAELLLGLALCANDAFLNELALASTREANALLADEPPSSLRARALSDLSRDLSVANDEAAAIEASEAAIAMAVEVGDLRTEALARGRIALSRAQQGDRDVDGRRGGDAHRPHARAIRFVVLSVYFNVGYLFDTLGDPGAGRGDPRERGPPLARGARPADRRPVRARGLVPVAGGPLGRRPPGRGRGRPRRPGASAAATSPSR